MDEISNQSSLPFLREIESLRSETLSDSSEAKAVSSGIINMTGFTSHFADVARRTTQQANQKEVTEETKNNFFVEDQPEAKIDRVARLQERIVFDDEKSEGELKDHKSDNDSASSGYVASGERYSDNSSCSNSNDLSLEQIRTSSRTTTSAQVKSIEEIRFDIDDAKRQLGEGDLINLINIAKSTNRALTLLMRERSSGNKVLRKQLAPSINRLTVSNHILQSGAPERHLIAKSLMEAENALDHLEREIHQEELNISTPNQVEDLDVQEYLDDFESLESSGGHTSLQERGSASHAEGATTVTSAVEDYSSDFESPELTSGTYPEIG